MSEHLVGSIKISATRSPRHFGHNLTHEADAPPGLEANAVDIHDRTNGAVSRIHFRLITLARWCCAAIVAHVVVDAYFHIRPGTSATDHFVSGTVPVATVAVIGASLDRVRAGVVALLSTLLGVAVVIGAGGAPVSALIGGRVDVSTVTGAVAAVAGATLLGCGVITLFRTRRRHGTRVRRWGRRAGLGVVGFMLVLVVSVPIGMGFMIANRSGGASATGNLGRPHEDVEIRTDDGVTIAGSYVPSLNGAAVIVFPGRANHGTTSRARMLTAHGYGVFVLDQRGLGKSNGDPNLLGWTGEADLRAAIRYLQTRPDVDPQRIGGLGLSVGGELMIQTAAHDPGLRAVVSEGAGTRWFGEDHTPMPFAVIATPFSAMMTAATAIFSDSLPPERLEDLIGEIAPRPVMLIWTRKGIGGEHLNPRYFDRAGEPKIIWEIPESTHVDGLATRPEEYERRVIQFLDDALLVEQP